MPKNEKNEKNEKAKVFDDFPTVDCNDCEAWWVNQCDGVSEAQKRSCTAFRPKRDVVIPQEIKWLRTQIFGLKVVVLCLAVILLVDVVGRWF